MYVVNILQHSFVSPGRRKMSWPPRSRGHKKLFIDIYHNGINGRGVTICLGMYLFIDNSHFGSMISWFSWTLNGEVQIWVMIARSTCNQDKLNAICTQSNVIWALSERLLFSWTALNGQQWESLRIQYGWQCNGIPCWFGWLCLHVR